MLWCTLSNLIRNCIHPHSIGRYTFKIHDSTPVFISHKPCWLYLISCSSICRVIISNLLPVLFLIYCICVCWEGPWTGFSNPPYLPPSSLINICNLWDMRMDGIVRGYNNICNLYTITATKAVWLDSSMNGWISSFFDQDMDASCIHVIWAPW